LPTHGDCKAVVALDITEGHHGNTRLDGLKTVAVLAWPGPIHEGKGEALIAVDDGELVFTSMPTVAQLRDALIERNRGCT
jgi:hypothetical protein